jgi:hypothetical protein
MHLMRMLHKSLPRYSAAHIQDMDLRVAFIRPSVDVATTLHSVTTMHVSNITHHRREPAVPCRKDSLSSIHKKQTLHHEPIHWSLAAMHTSKNSSLQKVMIVMDMKQSIEDSFIYSLMKILVHIVRH